MNVTGQKNWFETQTKSQGLRPSNQVVSFISKVDSYYLKVGLIIPYWHYLSEDMMFDHSAIMTFLGELDDGETVVSSC